jgi:DNA-binding beta-propeller fold protein YncE
LLSRRDILAISVGAASCGSQKAVFRGYAFIANQEGHALAAVDLQTLAVARHIPIDGAPSQVAAAWTRSSIYALTPETGTVHEIQSDRLSFRRKLTVASSALSMRLDPGGQALYVLASEPRALIRIGLDSFRVEWKVVLPAAPVDFDIASDGRTGAISLGSSVHFVDLTAQKLGAHVGSGDYGVARFRFDGRVLIACDQNARLLSLYDVESAKLITHLPVSLRPQNLCFKPDGGQLFITGEGLDAVVIVAPYETEVAETVLAGRAPGAMAASNTDLVVASPQSGDVSIFDILSRKLVAVVSVGNDPGFVAITPGNQFALVLNRKSGDVAVLRIGAVQRNRYSPAAPLIVIPVGSKPVSAAMPGV